jgi:hypothetical protein
MIKVWSEFPLQTLKALDLDRQRGSFVQGLSWKAVAGVRHAELCRGHTEPGKMILEELV